MPERNNPENEIGAGDDESKLGRLEIVGLFAAVLLLAALVWILVYPPPGLL